MLTLKDCIELCELDIEEINAIADHEHIPEIIAVEFGEYLVHCDDGAPRIRRMIIDDIEAARKRNDKHQVLKYETILKHFIATYPDRDKHLL